MRRIFIRLDQIGPAAPLRRFAAPHLHFPPGSAILKKICGGVRLRPKGEMALKTIGMIGGIGPESTLDYYRRIVEGCREKNGGCPEIVVDSVDMAEMNAMVRGGLWDELVRWLLKRIRGLQAAGAEFAFLASNTPHVVFDRLQGESPIPLVSIVEATRVRAQELGLRRVGLTGTGFTMGSTYYQQEFSKAGIGIVVPKQAERDYIEHKLNTEIELGRFLDETRNGLLAIIRRMIDEDGIEGLILGCTELPLILTKDEFGIPFLNTTEIHVERILRECCGETSGY